MTPALTRGLPAAVAAAVLYGTAPVAQAAAAREAPPGRGVGLGLLLGLLRRPLWLAGILCEIAGFLVEVYAFSVAPVALVAPVMALDTLVASLLAGRTLGERLSGSGRLGILAMALGIGLLAVAFGVNSALGAGASDGQLLVFTLIAATAVGIVARLGHLAEARGRRTGAALLFGAGAGISYALGTLSTRQIGLLLSQRQLWHVLITPTPYILIVFSIAGISLFQRGLQAGGATSTFPVTSGLAAFLPVVVSLTVLGEDTPSGPEEIAFVVALLLVASGITLLGRSRARIEQAAAREVGGTGEVGEVGGIGEVGGGVAADGSVAGAPPAGTSPGPSTSRDGSVS